MSNSTILSNTNTTISNTTAPATNDNPFLAPGLAPMLVGLVGWFAVGSAGAACIYYKYPQKAFSALSLATFAVAQALSSTAATVAQICHLPSSSEADETSQSGYTGVPGENPTHVVSVAGAHTDEQDNYL
jgi:hypothetical protein